MLTVDAERLQQFELQLDPVHPESGSFSVRVLGYGEISTVFAVGDDDLAYKRMPIFQSDFMNKSLGPLFSLAGLHHGVLTVYANNDTSVNQILPPLIITEAQVREVFESLDGMLTWLSSMV